MEIKEEKSAVIRPIKVIAFKIIGEYSKKCENLRTKKIPAVTIVAECSNAETGVGPSIASGNQECRPICADFPIQAPNKKKHIKSILFILIPKNSKKIE
jgi:hypothetical protein